MKPRAFDPHRLDVAAFAAAGGELQGEWPMDGFARLAEMRASATGPGVVWSAQGRTVAVRGAPPQTWLHLRGEATVSLVCQRCLEPVTCTIAVDRQFQFVADEATAERLDGEVEHEVLAVTRELDLQRLLEDELLLDAPIVPRHPDCSLAAGPTDPDAQTEPAPPFAALRAWRRDSGSG